MSNTTVLPRMTRNAIPAHSPPVRKFSAFLALSLFQKSGSFAFTMAVVSGRDPETVTVASVKKPPAEDEESVEADKRKRGVRSL